MEEWVSQASVCRRPAKGTADVKGLTDGEQACLGGRKSMGSSTETVRSEKPAGARAHMMVVLNWNCTAESPGELYKALCPAPTPQLNQDFWVPGIRQRWGPLSWGFGNQRKEISFQKCGKTIEEIYTGDWGIWFTVLKRSILGCHMGSRPKKEKRKGEQLLVMCGN